MIDAMAAPRNHSAIVEQAMLLGHSPIDRGVSSEMTMQAVDNATIAAVMGRFVANEAIHTTMMRRAKSRAALAVNVHRMGIVAPLASSRVLWQGGAQNRMAPMMTSELTIEAMLAMRFAFFIGVPFAFAAGLRSRC